MTELTNGHLTLTDLLACVTVLLPVCVVPNFLTVIPTDSTIGNLEQLDLIDSRLLLEVIGKHVRSIQIFQQEHHN